jgi:hypothetical protein
MALLICSERMPSVFVRSGLRQIDRALVIFLHHGNVRYLKRMLCKY